MSMKKVSFVYLPLLFLIYLSVETYLKLHHSSLCHSRGCELAGGLLNIPAIELNYIGIASAFLLFVLGYLTYIKAISSKVFFIFLSSMILFETIMLGYQYFASPELCKFCMGVYGSLLTIALFTMREKIVFLLPGIVAPLVALYLLAIPKSDFFVTKDANYLIQSQTCPHCKKVKEFLKKKNINFIKLDAKSIEARNFIKYMGYKTIPVLLVKKGSNITIINGDENIIEHFSKKDETKVTKTTPTSTSNPVAEEPIDLLSGAALSDGCGIELLEEKSCDKDNK